MKDVVTTTPGHRYTVVLGDFPPTGNSDPGPTSKISVRSSVLCPNSHSSLNWSDTKKGVPTGRLVVVVDIVVEAETQAVEEVGTNVPGTCVPVVTPTPVSSTHPSGGPGVG